MGVHTVRTPLVKTKAEVRPGQCPNYVFKPESQVETKVKTSKRVTCLLSEAEDASS